MFYGKFHKFLQCLKQMLKSTIPQKMNEIYQLYTYNCISVYITTSVFSKYITAHYTGKQAYDQIQKTQ